MIRHVRFRYYLEMYPIQYKNYFLVWYKKVCICTTHVLQYQQIPFCVFSRQYA